MPKISEYPAYIMLSKQRFKCKTCEQYLQLRHLKLINIVIYQEEHANPS